MSNEQIKLFYIDAIEHREFGTLAYNIEKIDNQIIIEYFDKIFDIIGMNQNVVQEMLSKLSPEEIEICLKKVINSDIQKNSTKLYILWSNLDEKIRTNNKELTKELIMQCANDHIGMIFEKVWSYADEEIKSDVCKDILELLRPLDELTVYLLNGTNHKILVQGLKEVSNPSQFLIAEIWGKLQQEVKDTYIFELIDESNDDAIRSLLWNLYNKNGERLQEAVERYKGNERLKNIIIGTNDKLLKKNIIEIIKNNVDDIDSLVYIWSGLKQKQESYRYSSRDSEDKEFFKETEEKFFDRILPLVKENPEKLIYIWKISPDKLMEKNPNFFDEIYEKVKNDNQLLIELWINTNESLQIKYKNIYQSVIGAAGGNSTLLESIWDKTSEDIKNENESVLVKIIELEKDNEYKIAEIWKNSPQIARVKSFKEICRKNYINEAELDEINKVYLTAYNENNDVANLMPTEFISFYSKQNIEILGKEKLIQIACYPDEVRKINSLNYKQVQTLGNCINRFMQKYGTSEWIYIFKDILDNIEDYNELINSKDVFTEDELDKLNIVLSDRNIFEIKNVQELMNIEQIRKKECDKLIKSWRPKDKIEAICVSKFGYSREKLEEILLRYGRDYEKFQNSNLKYFINSLEMLFRTIIEDEQLQKIYDEVTPVGEVNIRAIERELKNEFAKMYNETLFQIDEAVPNFELGENIYELPKDENGKIKEFNMIMTAIGAFNERNIDNYYTDWNQNSKTSQHFCASYINKYMLGHAGIKGICFGFSSLEKDSLVLLGPEDIGSSNEKGVSTAIGRENYYAPERLLDLTRRYNEMDIYRTVGGKQKQPDFIICFRKNGQIPNLEESKKASKEFETGSGKALPIVIIDEDEIQIETIDKINKLLEEFKDNPSKEVRDEIIRLVDWSGKYNVDISLTVFDNPKKRDLYNKIFWERDSEQNTWYNFEEVRERIDRIHTMHKSDEESSLKKLNDELYERMDREER